MANIIVFDTTTHSATSVSVTGTTWGEVKSQIPGFRSDMRVMIKETRMNVDNDGAEMPVGIGKDSSGNSNGKDYTLFLMPSKQKGAISTSTKDAIQAWEALVIEDIREKTQHLINYFENMEKLTEARLSEEEVKKLAEEAKNL